MAQQPDKSSGELSNSPTSSKKPKATEFVGGYIQGSVAKILEEQAKLSGVSKSQALETIIKKSSVGPVPEGIMNLAYSLVPVTFEDQGGQVVQATQLTGQTGVKTGFRGPDRRVTEAEAHQTAATNENLVWAYRNSVALRATLHLIAQTIIGAGWAIDSEDENAKKVIEAFIDSTNLPEWLEATIENLAIYGNNVNTLKYDEEKKSSKLIYVDWSTFHMFKHPITGETRYVQVVKIPTDLPKTEKDWKNFDITQSHTGTEEVKNVLDPEDVIHTKIGARGFEVGQSLIAPVITLVVYEKLIQWFMVQGAEIYGSPRIIASLELGEMPLAEDQNTNTAIQNAMNLVTAALQNFRNFGVLTLPPGWKVDIYGPGQHMMDYEKILNYIRRDEMLSCLGSTALFEAKGTELATSRTIETVWGYGLEGWRRVLKDTLDNQIFPKVLGMDRGATDVEINFNSEKKWTADEGAKLVQSGIITKEEAREEWGYPELPSEPPGPEQPPGSPGTAPPLGPPGQPPGLPTELPTGQPTSPLTAFELSNSRPKRDPRYEERIRSIEERTAKACQESLEAAQKRIRSIAQVSRPRKPEDESTK